MVYERPIEGTPIEGNRMEGTPIEGNRMEGTLSDEMVSTKISDEMTTRCENIFILLVDTERVYKLLNFEYDIQTILDYNAFLVALFQNFIINKKYLPLGFDVILENELLHINVDMLHFLETNSDILQELKIYYMQSINNIDNYEDDFGVINEFNVSSSLHAV